jgi:cell shape-determining protein MreC
MISRRAVLTVLLLAATASTFAGSGVSNWLRSRVSYVLAPLGDGAMYVATSAQDHASSRTGRAISPARAKQLEEQNIALRGQVLAFYAERQRLLRQMADIQNIRGQLYNPSPDIPYELIPAHVVAADSLPYGRTRLVDRGVSSGVASGQRVTTVVDLQTDRANALPENLAALSGSALVGRIRETSAFTARLVLLTDRDFRSPCLIYRDTRNRRNIVITESGNAAEVPLTAANNRPVACEVRGVGESTVLVENVKALHNILPGDWVFTDHESQPPLGIRIGQVTEVIPQQDHRGLFVNLRVKPHADLDVLRDVYIVLPMGRLPDAEES